MQPTEEIPNLLASFALIYQRKRKQKLEMRKNSPKQPPKSRFETVQDYKYVVKVETKSTGSPWGLSPGSITSGHIFFADSIPFWPVFLCLQMTLPMPL